MLLRLKKLAFATLHACCFRGAFRGVYPSVEHLSVLRNIDFDRVLDVGANRGQFALLIRALRPDVPVTCFEPLAGEAATLRAIFVGDPKLMVLELALSDESGTSTMHVSNRPDSSSLLPIGDLQTTIFPGTAEVGTEAVVLACLDDFPTHWQDSSSILLKIDVQGSELRVLRGAIKALTHCVYVCVECSDVPLYVGQDLSHNVKAFLTSCGFDLVVRYNESRSQGKLIQADYLFKHPAMQR